MEPEHKHVAEQQHAGPSHGHGAHHHSEAQGRPRGGMGPTHAIGIVAAIIIIIGVIYLAANQTSAQTVQKGDNVSVFYTGTLTNGTIFDTNVGKEPLNFTVGAGEMIPGFDQGVVGMRLDQNKTLTLPPAEAYGEPNPALVIQVPRGQFGNSTVAVGMRVQSTQGQMGIIRAVNATNVTVDFNSELAGQTLIFDVKVVSIKRG